MGSEDSAGVNLDTATTSSHDTAGLVMTLP